MHRPLSSAALAVLLAAAANGLGADRAEAAACSGNNVIEQEAFADELAVGSFQHGVFDCTGDSGTGIISRDVLAELPQVPDVNATSEAAVGRFGQYGVLLSQSAFVPAKSDAGVIASNTEMAVNRLKVPEHIELNIAIDGGSMESIGTFVSSIDYDYIIRIDTSGGQKFIFESRQELRTDASNNPSLVDLPLSPFATNIDLGATLSEPLVAVALVTIPPSLHTLDLGMLDPGDFVSGSFNFQFSIDQEGESGTLTGKFGDPITLSSAPIFGTLSIGPVGTAVPEPGTLGLITTGLVGLAAFSRRRR